MLGYTLYEAFKLPKEPRERMFAILFLIALNPVFWGLFEQAGGSLSLYTDKFVDRGGVPTSLFQSINPIYIVLLGPMFAGLWAVAGGSGPGALGAGQVRRWRWSQVGAGLPRLRAGARTASGIGGGDAGVLRVPDLSAPHHRRAVPVARSGCRR